VITFLKAPVKILLKLDVRIERFARIV